jgi:cell division protein ZapE
MQPIQEKPGTVRERLRSLVSAGELQSDPAQSDIADRLDQVLIDLKTQKLASKSSALGWLFAARKKDVVAPRGLYVFGQVGRGKTMLMDMFFELAPVAEKRRAHFHAFMLDVHERIHAHRQKLKNGETKQSDPMPPVAEALMREARLLCFDEFSVTDITDAMILSRLFSELFSRGCILVATSNVEPDNLYTNGLNRDLFLPFLGILKRHVDVMSLDARTDYRMEKTKSLPVYSHPLGPAADLAMDQAFDRLTSGLVVKPVDIQMKSRQLHVPRAAKGIARFAFSDLCEKPLGASDYLAIAKQFHTIFLDHVPYLGPSKRNETKRFIILIDTFYDHSVRLFISAADLPEKLLTHKQGTEGFEFDRTASRLFEIRSEDYLETHIGNRRKQ